MDKSIRITEVITEHLNPETGKKVRKVNYHVSKNDPKNNKIIRGQGASIAVILDVIKDYFK